MPFSRKNALEDKLGYSVAVNYDLLPRARRSKNDKWAEKKRTKCFTPYLSSSSTVWKIFILFKDLLKIICSAAKSFKHWKIFLAPGTLPCIYQGIIRMWWVSAWIAKRVIEERRWEQLLHPRLARFRCLEVAKWICVVNFVITCFKISLVNQIWEYVGII